jgi:arylsulfatase A-like enzyme
MPKTQRLLGEQGTTFTNSFVSLSLCCPARVAVMSGQHATNNGVWANTGPIGGYPNHDAANALPTWLSAAGYTNIHIGKAMHGTGDTIPPGWHDWRKPRGNDSNMFDWTLADNDKILTYGSSETDYQTDVYARHAVEAIKENADGPFFMEIATSAPHVGGVGEPPVPAPRHAGTFTEPLPRPPSFNVADDGSLLTQEDIGQLQRLFRARAESLMAVDDLVETVVEALEAHDILDDTVVIFSSDNGYMLGEHAQSGKVVYYEESIGVPLLIRGPGFTPGSVSTVPVQNVDYPVTIADIAGATPTIIVDGRSIYDLIDDDRQDRALFIMSSRTSLDSTDWWTGIRTGRFTYVRFATGQELLFDLVEDPDQLVDLGSRVSHAAVREALSGELDAFERCAGASCDRDIDDDVLIALVDEGAGDAVEDIAVGGSDECVARSETLTATKQGLGTSPTVTITTAGTTAELEWEAVDGASEYRVRIRARDDEWSQPVRLDGLQHTFDGVCAGVSYQVQVASRVDQRWSPDWTNVVIPAGESARAQDDDGESE